MVKRLWWLDRGRLVQWCHGAPGFLPLLAELHGRVPAGSQTARTLEAAADRAADVTWERGLLTKVWEPCMQGEALPTQAPFYASIDLCRDAPTGCIFLFRTDHEHCPCMQGMGLCHGISGNAYALLSAHRMTGDARRLRQASELGVFMAQRWPQLLSGPDRPVSLFEVHAIACCLVGMRFARFLPVLRAAWRGVVECHEGWTARNKVCLTWQGLAGAVCFWADMADPANARFPGYEL